MNEQHETRLGELAEKLADVFLDEADPAQWAGAGETPKGRTKEERGDRQWDLKNANQLGLLVARALELKQRVRWIRQAEANPDDPPAPPPGGELGNADPEHDMQRLQAEAVALIERVQRRRS